MATEKPHILVVEDDETLALGLELNLQAEGFSVELVMDGREGLQRALSGRADLLILDLMLPGIDGYRVLREMREKGIEIPVIVLTARSQLEDKLRGFGLGADDYVTKPFRLEELVARAQAALRRGKARATRVETFGDVEMDMGARRVTRAGEVVPMTSREFDLLAYLYERASRVHSRERLLHAVWGEDYEGTERTVDNFIRSLRKKLEDDPAKPRYLVTVRGAGYRFEK